MKLVFSDLENRFMLVFVFRFFKYKIRVIEFGKIVFSDLENRFTMVSLFLRFLLRKG